MGGGGVDEGGLNISFELSKIVVHPESIPVFRLSDQND